MLQREREWNVVDRFIPTFARSRDGAYVMLRLKAENPNQPLSSVEKGCLDCERMNVRAAKPPVNRKFAGSCQSPMGRPGAGTSADSGKSTQPRADDGQPAPGWTSKSESGKRVITR